MGFPWSGKLNRNDLLVALSIILYTLVLSSYTLAKHYSFTTYAWDLGLFNQAFWSTAFTDKIFYYTCELHLVESGSFFGVHFSPILFTILPIYFLRPEASTLLIVQSFLLGLSALPIYKLAQTRFTERQSVLLSSVYLLNPALHGVNSYDFHVQAFLPLLLNYLLYYVEIDNVKGTLVATNLALAVQEQVFYIILAFLGFYLIKKKHRLIPPDIEKRTLMVAGLILLSAFTWKYASTAVIQHYNPQIPEHLKAGQHYLALGVNDPAKIPQHILRNPGSIVNALIYEWYNKLFYLFCLFSPYLFLLTNSLTYLIPTIPWFTVSLLSNYPPYYRIGFQYAAYTVPFIYTGFIKGVSQLKKRGGNHDPVKSISLLLIAASLALSPLSPLTSGFFLSPAYQKPEINLRTQRMTQIKNMIPRNSSILTQDNFFPHLSSRREAYVMIPATFRDIKTWKNAMQWITRVNAEYILLDMETDPHGTSKYLIDIARQEDYGLVTFYDNIYLYKRNFNHPPLQYENINQTYHVSELVLINGVETTTQNNTNNIYSYLNTTNETTTLWYGPYEIMPQGNYHVDFRVKTLNNNHNTTINLDAFANQTQINYISFTENQLTNNTWTNLGFNFTLPNNVYDLELRGILHGNKSALQLDYIRLIQIG